MVMNNRVCFRLLSAATALLIPSSCSGRKKENTAYDYSLSEIRPSVSRIGRTHYPAVAESITFESSSR